MTLHHAAAEYILFSDFDGTITTEDSNDWLTDNLGYGKERRLQVNKRTLDGQIGFREAFADMLNSLHGKYTFAESQKHVHENIKLEPGFNEMLAYSKHINMPVVVVSSGMEPIIRSILSNLIGKDEAQKIEVISNFVDIDEKGFYKVRYRHPESSYGHDKSQALRPYMQMQGRRPTILFCGDGVSDMSAAAEADVLFVCMSHKRNNDLAVHCARKNIPYIPFISFTEVQEVTQRLVEKKVTVEQLKKGQGFDDLKQKVRNVLATGSKALPEPLCWKA